MRKDLGALHKKEERGEIGLAASNEPPHPIAVLLDVFLSTGSEEARRAVLKHPYRGAVVLLGKRLGPDENWSVGHERLVELLKVIDEEEVQNPKKSGAFPGSPVARFFATWSRWARGEATAEILEGALEAVKAFKEAAISLDLSFLLTKQLGEDWDEFGFDFQSQVLASIAVRLDAKMVKIRALLGDARLANWLAIDIERQLGSHWEAGREPNAKWISALVDLEGCSERALAMLAKGRVKGLWVGLARKPSFVPHFCELLHN